MLAAGIAKCLRQMRFSCSRRSNKGQVAVRINRTQGGQCPDPVQVSAFQQRKVEVFNGFRRLFRQPAQFEQCLDGGLLFLFTDVGKDSLYRLNGFF